MNTQEIEEYFEDNPEAREQLEGLTLEEQSEKIEQYEEAMLNIELHRIYVQEARIY